MGQSFARKEVALWLHPLGLFYRVRVVSTGRNPELGHFAIISVKNKLVVCVSQDDLRRENTEPKGLSTG